MLVTCFWMTDGGWRILGEPESSTNTQHIENGIQYLTQLQNGFGTCNYGQYFVDHALITT